MGRLMRRTGEIMVVCFEWWSWLEMGTPGACCMFIKLAFWRNHSIFLDEPLLPPPSMWFVLWDWLHTYRVWLLTVEMS